MQLCHQQLNKDVQSLFLLGMALCIIAVLGLTEVPQRLTRAVHRIQHYIIRVSLASRRTLKSLWQRVPGHLRNSPSHWENICASLLAGHLLSEFMSLHMTAVSALNILVKLLSGPKWWGVV